MSVKGTPCHCVRHLRTSHCVKSVFSPGHHAEAYMKKSILRNDDIYLRVVAIYRLWVVHDIHKCLVVILWTLVNTGYGTISCNRWRTGVDKHSNNVDFLLPIERCISSSAHGYHHWGSVLRRHGPELSHWGRVTHICVSKLTIIGSDNGLAPGRHQAIICTNAGILLIGPLGTNFIEILIAIETFSFKKKHLKMSSGKCRPFCLGLNELRPVRK